jgi:hypothetical protein
MLGLDLGISYRGMRLVAELASTHPGGWDDLGTRPIFGVDPGRFEWGSFSSIFSEYTAFSAELLGFSVRSQPIGRLGLTPGYRYSGAEFIDPQGEINGAFVESYLTLWWKHHTYDVSLSCDAARTYTAVSGSSRNSLYETMRMRFNGGFELRESLFLNEKMRPSLALSFLDENSRSRLVTTVRLDDLGDENDLSFIAEGGVNIGRKWIMKSVLYLHRSAESLYHFGLEFRPDGRFLLGTAFGTFLPGEEDIMLNRSLDFPVPERNKTVLLFARIWLGDL